MKYKNPSFDSITYDPPQSGLGMNSGQDIMNMLTGDMFGSKSNSGLQGIIDEIDREKSLLARDQNALNSLNQQSAVIPGGTSSKNKGVVLNSNDPFAASIKHSADQNLGYGQDRTKGKTTDCSAFTQKIFKDTTGKNIGGWTEEQWKNGSNIASNNAQNGDLVFFKSGKNKYKNRNVTHVGKYNGDGTFTHMGTNGLTTTPLEGYGLNLVGFKRYG